MKKFLGLVFIFGIAYVLLVYKPSICIPHDDYRGFYDTPLSEMIIINGVPLSEVSSIEEEEQHVFDMDYLITGEGSVLDKCLYLHDSIHDSGGIGDFITNTMSKDMQDRVTTMMDDANQKLEENLNNEYNEIQY